MVKPRENRVPIMLSDKELATIEDWRFESRIATRSEAIRRLCQIGLVFDANRTNIIDQARDLVLAVERAARLATGDADFQAMTDREREVADASLNALQAALRFAPVIRLTTGIANNFKGADDIEVILNEAEEILTILQKDDRGQPR